MQSLTFSGTTTAAAAALWLWLWIGSVSAYRSSSYSVPRSTDFIDCNDPCNGGDANYELIASIQTIRMGFGGHTYRGRTFARPDPNTGRVPDGQHMGPTMTVQPGQSLWIKFRNELFWETTKDLYPLNVTTYDYWSRLVTPGEKIKYKYYKPSVASPDLMEVDVPNVPKNFDVTNLHLHGLDVQVHMFDPVGTHDPDAPHVAIKPGECYCYRFDLPEDHPDGLYWYHPHLHGSSAVQLWGGMMGLLNVVGSFSKELRETYNVLDTRDFVVWDPVFQDVSDRKPGAEHSIEVDEFLLGQTTLSKIHPFLVNGEINPEFANVGVGEVLHLRVLCGTIENEHTFIVYKAPPESESENVAVDYSKYDWKEHAIPFHVVASDGVAYPEPIQRDVVVLAGGQREEFLLQFDEPGTYVVSQQGIQGLQFFDMYGHPHDQILATFRVIDKGVANTQLPTVPIPEMRFRPGYAPEETIRYEEIARTETIVFSMGSNRNMAPFPQYYINGKAFSPDRLDFRANPGEAVEYILVNANHNYHPFHIHVNRFQVQEMGSELSTEKYPILEEMIRFNSTIWRDTIAVPPNGRTRIWVRYKNYTGKTVLHCHFLAHEDTGMMATLFIGPPDVKWWKEHKHLVVACVMGALVGSVLLLLLVVACGWCSGGAGRNDAEHHYSLVRMNEYKTNAKTKTLD
mmetsp:Transcript_4567/g.13147  ORF Transcript_4567/g.13147 Transcript_4567/m.13147 type:complete len:682 (-) Transcript_4567:564-2609(-)